MPVNRAFIPSMRLEDELLLCCARIQLDSGRAERIRALVQDGVNWAYLLWKAFPHAMLPLLYWHLNATCPGAVPGSIFKQLQGHFHSNIKRNLFLTGELLSLLNMFEEHGIRALSYKGPLLAASVYGNLGLRQFADLDLLVSPREVPKAKELLLSRGYQPRFPLSHTQEAAYLQTKSEEIFVREGGGVFVKLHWGVAAEYFSLPLDVERLWKRLQPLALGGRTLCTLSPEDLLLILCVDGATYLWGRLGRICDVAELIRAHERMDWQQVLEQSRRLGVERMLFLGLRLAAELLGANLPAEVLQRVQVDPKVEALTTKVRERFLRETVSPPEILESSLFHLRTRESWREKVRYLLSRTLTPSPGDWTFVQLPVSLSFLYPLIRPIRLLQQCELAPLKRLLGLPSDAVTFVPTQMELVESVLSLAEVTPADIVYDLGCGDGRVVIQAAKRYGARGVGIDIDPERIAEANANACKEGVDHLVTFVRQHAMAVDLSSATVVTLFMTPSWNISILPKLQEELRPGARIVSLYTDMGNWIPLQTELMMDADGACHVMYLWRIEKALDQLAAERLARGDGIAVGV